VKQSDEAMPKTSRPISLEVHKYGDRKEKRIKKERKLNFYF
jgi:hypothetical protein